MYLCKFQENTFLASKHCCQLGKNSFLLTSFQLLINGNCRHLDKMRPNFICVSFAQGILCGTIQLKRHFRRNLFLPLFKQSRLAPVFIILELCPNPSDPPPKQTLHNSDFNEVLRIFQSYIARQLFLATLVFINTVTQKV